jgi:anti-sigma factor RsiW
MADTNHNTNFDDELLSAYVDGELTVEERTVVEARLESDPAARELVAELRGLSRKLRSLPRERNDEDVRSLVMAQIGESKVSLPSREPSRNNLRILLWPAVMIAAALMLMFTQGNEEPRDRELARVEPAKEADDRAAGERLALDKTEESASETETTARRRSLEISAAEPAAEGVVADNAPAGGAGGLMTTDGASELREEAAPTNRDLARPEFALAPDPELSNQLRSALANTEAELGIVHLTLTDLPAGVEKFDRLLISNGVQVDNLSEANGTVAGVPSSESATLGFDGGRAPVRAADAASGTVMSGRAGGLGGGMSAPSTTRDGADETKKSEPEMILVEAPAEQIANILISCSQDTQAIKEVKIDPTASGLNTKREKQRLTDYQQYERGAVAKDQSKSYSVSPAQQGVIEALNSIDAPVEQVEAPVEGESNQGWAAKLRNDQPPADLKQLNTDYNSRRNNYFYNARQQQAAVPPDQKLAKDKVSGEQWMRVLFLLHPDEDSATK